MRHVILSTPLVFLFACGDDAVGSADGLDATGGDTSVIFDTDPGKDTSDPGSGTNKPPELERIGDRTVAVGQRLSITLNARDPDGDPLTYSVFGNLPDGARFDKTEHRFEWAPTEAGVTVFLTFVVSDGKDFDRETVRIQVTATAEAHPPVFADVGDQTLRVGEPYTLQLVATDPDGDKLSYGHEGSLPNGASLDPRSGLFSWRPQASDAGSPIRITFTVTDGAASDSMTVRFVVDDGGGNVNKPPVFTPIPAQTVRVGETLTLTLQASDPDGDALSFSIQGATPAGASLSGASFAYQPPQSAVGQTVEVRFAVSDGNFTAVTSVEISVISGQTASCTPDPEEPNEDNASATPLGAGTRNGTVCETESNDDVDTYAIEIPAGQELTATLTFDAGQGDLDLLLSSADNEILAESDGVTSTEELSYAAGDTTTVYLAVYGYGLEPLSMSYTLQIELSHAAACTDDGYEPNDTAAQAKPLDASAESATLQICAGNEDYWTFPVGCGAKVEVLMEILDQEADLDLALYDEPTGSEEPVEIAISEEPSELISIETATRPGTWLLQVSGYPAASAEGRYQLVHDVSGACQDDQQGGLSSQNATPLTGASGGLDSLTRCCSDDWFSFSLSAGDQVVVDLVIGGSGSIGAVVYSGDAQTQVAAEDPSPEGGILSFSATSGGVYFLKVTGAVRTSYSFSWEVESASASCTDLSCPKYEVCDSSIGECVLDYCLFDEECPFDYVCRETYCVNACFGDLDCRPDYACKVFDDIPLTTYCGVEGSGATGAGCDTHADCEGALACIFDASSGYCAELDCAFCPPGSTCEDVDGLAFCAKTCDTSADCREADGYVCSSDNTCVPQSP